VISRFFRKTGKKRATEEGGFGNAAGSNKKKNTEEGKNTVLRKPVGKTGSLG